MQCNERFRPARPPIDRDAGAPRADEIVAGGLGIIAGEAHPGSDEGIGEAFVVAGGSVTWTCGRCGGLNQMQESACSACGMTFADSARRIADSALPAKQSRSILKAVGILAGGAVVMRLVAGLISPWAAAGVLGAAALRTVIRYTRP